MIPPFYNCYSKECMFQNELSAFLHTNIIKISRGACMKKAN
ncbi:hypothetical protein CN425_08190 [Bacillus cereus]|uniref:Uncharacterized protein n=1 Tax=Bacillus cereus TaxID=1396 RepID=A0A2A8PZ24_BACCE|nr:hypothetical protein CN425_08190 [Bacillus cereus]